MKKQIVSLGASVIALAIAASSARIRRMTESSGNKVPEDPPVSAPITSIKQLVGIIKAAFSNKNIPLLAAGVAYFATLAFFPLLAAAVSIAAFVISESQLQTVVTSLNAYLPADIASLITTQLQNLSTAGSSNILVATIAIAISLFSVSGAVQNLMKAVGQIYDSSHTRGFIKDRLLSLAMTAGLIMVAFIVIPLLIVTPEFLQNFGVPAIVTSLLPYARWIILIGVVTVVLALLYRFSRAQRTVQWQWISWGAGIATVLWLVGTALFFIYAQYFANFSDSYSLFAGIVVLMIWINLSAFIALFGAEINHRIETMVRNDES